ncbi:MAG: DUF502 domain-containing protein [Verrucomicrobiota bacterium]
MTSPETPLADHAIPPAPAMPAKMPSPKEDPKGFLVWVRNKLITGLFVAGPLIITVWILQIIYHLVNSISDPFVRAFVHQFEEILPAWMIVDETIPGAGLILTLMVLFALGLIVSNFIGKKIIHWIDKFLSHFPVVQTIYKLAKQIVEAFERISKPGEFENKQVVYVRYPGMQEGYFIGFLTGRFTNAEGKRMVTVLIPTSPNPITGIVLVLNEDTVLISDLEMDTAWKLIVSAGLVTPRKVRQTVKPLSAGLSE